MTDLRNPTRRTFLKGATLAVPLAFGMQSAEPQDHPSETAPMWSYLGKSTRLSIAMWDFSWLISRYPGGPYDDLERRVAEAAERGYNALRVDCFPSRLLERESTFPQRNWVPGVNLPQWGENAAEHTCSVRTEVANLARLCRKYDIWLGLDSWDKAHMFRAAHPSFAEKSGAPSDLIGGKAVTTISQDNEEGAFTAYGETWVKALKLMRDDGVLERAVWIAPMNEVPHFGGRSVESVIALGHNPKNEGETKLETAAELDAIYRRLNDYMGAPIRSEVSKERIPLSYSSLGAENYAARLTDTYDVVDIHFMPEVILDDDDKRAFQKAGPGAPFGVFQDFEKCDLAAYSGAWDRACQKHYSAMLESVRKYFKTALEHTTLASGKQLQAIVTEAYGPCFWPDSPKVDWEWYKRYNADALRVVAAMGLTGATLSNYGEPLFTLWNDVGWHWAGNSYFRTNAPTSRT